MNKTHAYPDVNLTSPSSEGVQFKEYCALDDCLRMYCPEKALVKEKTKRGTKSTTHNEKMKHNCSKYCAHGMNLLNRDSLEIHEIKERLSRRKQQHTKVERQRRELINSSIEEIAKILPPSYIDHDRKNARGLVLQQTIHYLHALREENAKLKKS
ncbi:hypothetical protein DSO57_1007294 [Entomophthora muscae]|uniref:Uncharacterized protein n=1 Tax=Entomophthora muscae TaxID=34485 RepID=A0ACC2RM80_9FUNG|nr:hypothetical protein DSO57_1007294 [Entomophthora muscae]